MRNQTNKQAKSSSFHRHYIVFFTDMMIVERLSVSVFIVIYLKTPFNLVAFVLYIMEDSMASERH